MRSGGLRGYRIVGEWMKRLRDWGRVKWRKHDVVVLRGRKD